MSDRAAQSRAFDFEVGNWRVTHRRLKERLRASDAWEEFDGHASVQLVLGGLGNVEDNIVNMPGGTYRAIALRSFDEASGLWVVSHFEIGEG